MATTNNSRTVHDWSTGQLVETQVEMTPEEIAENEAIAPNSPALPDSE
jgi:hypothetical protein